MSKAVTNYMDGISYRSLDPLVQLELLCSSSILGEPSYYESTTKSVVPSWISKYTIFEPEVNRLELFQTLVRKSLSINFLETLNLAMKLKTEFYMRRNPCYIFVEACIHPDRKKFTSNYFSLLGDIGLSIITRPDDIYNQFEYYSCLNTHKVGKDKKQGIPSILKRLWKKSINNFSRYQLKKYLKTGQLINMVRICHANNWNIDEMMKTGDIAITEEQETWERLRSAGKDWAEIVTSIQLPYLASLRNLRNMVESSLSPDLFRIRVLEPLLQGVETSKQFPFQFYSAYNSLSYEINILSLMARETLEKCMSLSVTNLPKLSGRVISLCDNSGSAHGTCTSEYGSVTVSDIANLSGVISAMNADYGEVGVFGDQFIKIPIDKTKGVLEQHTRVREQGGIVGRETENGIWIFFKKAIEWKEHYDYIFIYSDMQAGHGGLYGINSKEYQQYCVNRKYIDVLALVNRYRQVVNSKVVVICTQVAGYTNSVLPTQSYRTANLYGWTGKECQYAVELNQLWDRIDTVAGN